MFSWTMDAIRDRPKELNMLVKISAFLAGSRLLTTQSHPLNSNHCFQLISLNCGFLIVQHYRVVHIENMCVLCSNSGISSDAGWNYTGSVTFPWDKGQVQVHQLIHGSCCVRCAGDQLPIMRGQYVKKPGVSGWFDCCAKVNELTGKLPNWWLERVGCVANIWYLVPSLHMLGFLTHGVFTLAGFFMSQRENQDLVDLKFFCRELPHTKSMTCSFLLLREKSTQVWIHHERKFPQSSNFWRFKKMGFEGFRTWGLI